MQVVFGLLLMASQKLGAFQILLLLVVSFFPLPDISLAAAAPQVWSSKSLLDILSKAFHSTML